MKDSPGTSERRGDPRPVLMKKPRADREDRKMALSVVKPTSMMSNERVKAGRLIRAMVDGLLEGMRWTKKTYDLSESRTGRVS